METGLFRNAAARKINFRCGIFYFPLHVFSFFAAENRGFRSEIWRLSTVNFPITLIVKKIVFGLYANPFSIDEKYRKEKGLKLVYSFTRERNRRPLWLYPEISEHGREVVLSGTACVQKILWNGWPLGKAAIVETREFLSASFSL